MNLCDPEMARFLLARGATLDSILERYPIADTEGRLVSHLLDE